MRRGRPINRSRGVGKKGTRSLSRGGSAARLRPVPSKRTTSSRRRSTGGMAGVKNCGPGTGRSCNGSSYNKGGRVGKRKPRTPVKSRRMSRGGRLNAMSKKGGRAQKSIGRSARRTMRSGGNIPSRKVNMHGRNMANGGSFRGGKANGLGFGSCKDQFSETSCKDMGCRWNYNWSSCG